MRLTRPRFTVRRMMVVVAISAVVLWGIVETRRRREKFLRIADFHESHSPYTYPGYYMVPITSLIEWREQIEQKYRRAASRPWLPVEPDPPSPPESNLKFGPELPTLDMLNGDDSTNPFQLVGSAVRLGFFPKKSQPHSGPYENRAHSMHYFPDPQ